MTPNETKIGVFVSAAVIVLVALVIAIGDFESLVAAKKQITIAFHNAKGLKAGDVVNYAGVQAGRVSHIGFKNQQGLDGRSHTRILVTCTVLSAVQLKKDSKAMITVSLTGSRAIEITPGEGPPLEKNHMEGISPSDLDSLSQSADLLLANFNTALEKINVLLTTLEEKGEVERLLAEIHGMLDDTRALIKSGENLVEESRPQIKATLSQLQALLDKAHHLVDRNDENLHQSVLALKETMEAVNRLIRDNEEAIGKMIADLGQAAVDAQAAITAMKRVLDEGKPPLDATLASMEVASDNLKQMFIDLRARPWRLIRRDGKKDRRHNEIQALATGLSEQARIIRNLMDTGGGHFTPAQSDALQTAVETYRRLQDQLTQRLNSLD